MEKFEDTKGSTRTYTVNRRADNITLYYDQKKKGKKTNNEWSNKSQLSTRKCWFSTYTYMYSRKCGIYTLAVKDLHFIYTNLKTIWFQNILTSILVKILKDIQTCCFLLDWLQVAAELLFLYPFCCRQVTGFS